MYGFFSQGGMNLTIRVNNQPIMYFPPSRLFFRRVDSMFSFTSVVKYVSPVASSKS